MKPTTQEIQAALGVVRILGDAVKTAGKDGIPSGHLYTMVMDKLSLESYDKAMNLLKGAKLVKEENHLLTWIGPQ